MLAMALSNFCAVCGVWVSGRAEICRACGLGAGVRAPAGVDEPAERCTAGALRPAAIHAARGMYWPCTRRRATTT